jgi:hypothetical protein
MLEDEWKIKLKCILSKYEMRGCHGFNCHSPRFMRLRIPLEATDSRPDERNQLIKKGSAQWS